MQKNVASQKIGCQMVSATDGSAFTGSVTVYVTGDAGTQAVGSVGSGACTHEGNGYHTYAPAQGETNYDLIAFTFTGTGAVPATVQVYTRHDANVTHWLGTAPLALSSQRVQAVVPDTQKVDVETIKTQAVTCAAGVTVGVFVGGTGASALEATAQSILADTNELQTDWANGGRLDLLVDSIIDDTGTSGVVVASGSKAGYSLTPVTGLGNQTADITGWLSGSVGSVTAGVTLADGVTHGGTTAKLRLGSTSSTPAFEATNSAGPAVRFRATAGNNEGLQLVASGAGSGLYASGGNTGTGFYCEGGATSGNGWYCYAPASGHGIVAEASGSGKSSIHLAAGVGASAQIAGNLSGTVTTTTNLTNLPAITSNWLTAAGLASDAVAEIQSGLATAVDLATLTGYVDTEVAAIKTKTDFLPSATAGAAGGLLIAGSNAATTFATLTVSGATTLTGNVALAAGMTITQSTINGDGLSITGNGSGSGLLVVSGSASGGAGLYAAGGGGNNNAMQCFASGSGNGLIASAGPTCVGGGIQGYGGSGSAAGILGKSGASGGAGAYWWGWGTNAIGEWAVGSGTGAGMYVESASNAHAVHIAGSGTGQGVHIKGGATGPGLEINGGATSGAAILATTAGGTGDVMSLSGNITQTGDMSRSGSTTLTGAVVASNASNNIVGIDVAKISGDSIAADNAEAFFDGTGYAGTNNVIPTVTTLTNLPAITANWITAAGLASDAVAEIQSGLATAAAVLTLAGYVDTEVAAIKAKTDLLPAAPAAVSDIPTVSQIWTTVLTEAYRATGATGTAAQLLYEILQNITAFAITGTTKTVTKLDGLATAKTYNINDESIPTGISEAT